MSSYLDYKSEQTPTGWRKILYLNWPLVFLLAAVASTGFLMLYSVAGGHGDVWAEPQIERFAVGMVAMFALAFLIGGTGSVLNPAIQARIMRIAGDAELLGAATNHAAFNVGNALGAALGGAVIAAGFGYLAPAWIGVALAIFNFIWWFGFAYGLGSRPVEDYTYTFGIPDWFFWSCIVGFVLMSIITILLAKFVLTDMPLDDDPAYHPDAPNSTGPTPGQKGPNS